MKTASDIRASARNSLSGNYLYAFLVSLLANWIMTAGPSTLAGSSIGKAVTEIVTHGGGFAFSVNASAFSILTTIAGMILTGSLTVGLASYYIKLCDRANPGVDDVIAPFKTFGNVFSAYLLTMIFVFLKTLLFIIPGIAQALSYALTPYILAEHPEIKARDAMKMSADMMKGNRCRLLRLYLSFTGWFILAVLTCGIGFAFLTPYTSAATAEFFNEISGKNYEKEMYANNFENSGDFEPREEEQI